MQLVSVQVHPQEDALAHVRVPGKSGQRAFREASRGKLTATMEPCLDKIQRKPFLTAGRPEKKWTGRKLLGDVRIFCT